LAKTVSRTHAELKYNPLGRECLLGDKGSLNGTYVNGERLKKDKYRVLRDGDIVRFGNAQLQFRENLR
jgi:pSer/pThr/pTyr-binding forkhead associated (FHA) protein